MKIGFHLHHIDNKLKFAFLIIFLCFNTFVFSQADKARKTTQKFSTTLQLIEFGYVDSIDSPDLVEKAIIAMLKELDPHSAYIKAEDVKRLNEPLEAEFDGIGVTFQLFNDTILVIAPVPGGPSDKLGILAGDKIIKINGEDAFGKKINNEYVMKLLRGKKGTSVDVSILRSGKDELIDFTIVRDKIPINSIDATYMAAPEIGYIKLTRFAKSSVQEFNESLSRLRAQGMKDLILDLRGNTGGYLNIAVDLADQFLSDKKMIVYTEGLRSPKQEFFSTGSGDFLRGKLIVLINESSASASEIVSGAVQDWDRGLVVGRRSFGKGLVQRPFNLPDGAMIRLTTARYYTPSGRCIQKPYEHGETEEYYKDLTKRLESGELVDSNSIELADSLKYFTSNDRVVYGGGGIIPDIFTPIDSTRFSDFYSDLVRKGIFNTYNLNYLEKNRKRVLKEYPNVESFKEKFIVTDEMYADFLDLAKEKNVERKETEKYYYPDNDLKIQIKALIARNLWDTNAYFRLINELDDELNVAVDLMQSGKAFTDLNLH
jgi:carboxyl-terminal processing protease